MGTRESLQSAPWFLRDKNESQKSKNAIFANINGCVKKDKRFKELQMLLQELFG